MRFDSAQSCSFLKKAFGVTENYRLTMSYGKIAHCELKLLDSVLNLGESMEGWPAHGLVAQLYVEDSDALFKRAIEAGAKEIMPMTDMFFGSREGRVSDPYGNVWGLTAESALKGCAELGAPRLFPCPCACRGWLNEPASTHR